MKQTELEFHLLLRRLRKKVASPYTKGRETFREMNDYYINSLFLVRFFYLASAYLSYEGLMKAHANALKPPAANWQWPVHWLEYVDNLIIISYLGVLSFLVCLMCTLFFYSRILRVLAFLLVFQVAAIDNSYGAVNHGFHLWLWLLFIFIFLPVKVGASVSRANKYHLLTVIVWAQIFLLLTYTMAGTWKVLSGVEALVNGGFGNFSLSGLAYQLANRSTQTFTSPLLADFFIDNPWLSGPAYWSLIFIQFLSVFIALRPGLHRTWGFLLIMFHFGTAVTMNITFGKHVLWLSLFFLLSPFSKSATGLLHRTERIAIGHRS